LSICCDIYSAVAESTFHDGLPQFAAIVNGHPNLQIVRRYTWLRTMCILDLQNELQGLENQIKSLYEDDNGRPKKPAENQTSENDMIMTNGGSTRGELMATIREKLHKYGELIDQQQRFLGYRDPEKISHYYLLSFRENLETALKEEEYEWIIHGVRQGDLATLAPDRFHTIFDNLARFIVGLVPLSRREKV